MQTREEALALAEALAIALGGGHLVICLPQGTITLKVLRFTPAPPEPGGQERLFAEVA